MNKKYFGAIALSCALLFGLGAQAQEPTDQYGGIIAAPSPSGATNSFRVEKNHSRWYLVSPAGNYMWLTGVYNISPSTSIDYLGSSYAARVKLKYPTTQIWAKQSTLRIKSWGFNSIAEYASTYTLPTSNTVKMPFFLMLRPSLY